MANFYSSRLDKKQDEEITQRTVLFGVLTIIILIVTLVFGLPFLVKVSVLLGESKNKNSHQFTEKMMPPLPPRLLLNYDATNSAVINIRGISEPKTNVKLLKNDVLIGQEMTLDSGDFVFDNIILDEGENQFVAIASNEKLGSSELSKMVRINYDNVLPSLIMLNPSEDTLKVDTADFDIIGQSEKDVSVKVNNHYAMVDDTGKFKLKMQLNSGKNDYEMVVRDLAGNEVKKKITITYDF